MARNVKRLANVLNTVGTRLIIRALAVSLFRHLIVCEFSWKGTDLYGLTILLPLATVDS